MSDALWRRLGYDRAELSLVNSLRQWRALAHPDDQRGVQQALEQHVAGESASFEVEYRIRAQDGDWHTIVERGRVAERDIRGRPLIVLGIAADVTERKRADEALALNERRFRTMFDSAFQFQCMLDLDACCVEANRGVLEFAGVTMDEVRGRKLWDTPWWRVMNPNEQREQVERACADALQGRTVRYEVEWAGKGGAGCADRFLDQADPGRRGPGLPTARRGPRCHRSLAGGKLAMREMEALSSMGRLAAGWRTR